MKLVQKTLLASAVAVAFSSAAFADVTVSGKLAGETQIISKVHNSEHDALSLASDGIKLSFDGIYDIKGGNQAGFKFGIAGNAGNTLDEANAGKAGQFKFYDKKDYEAGGNLWRGGQPVTIDKANLFIKGGWGQFAFGRLALPSDDIKNDIWDNSVLAASAGEYAGGSSDNALAYSYGNDSFTVGVAIAAVNKQYIEPKPNAKRKMVTGDQFVSDIAATVNVGPAKLKAGFNYDAKKFKNDGRSKGAIGADVKLGDDVLLTGTVGFYQIKVGSDTKVANDLLLGASYKFGEVVTGKFTVAMQDLGDKNKDELDPMQLAVGADYTLATNITAFTVLSFKNKENKSKKAEDQVGLGTGLTLKF